VCIAFYTRNDDKAEIRANAESLMNKYGVGRPLADGRIQRFYRADVAEGDNDPLTAILEACAGIPKGERDVGIYFLCHGAATNMHPRAVNLATLAFLVAQRRGFGFRKISLAACKSAGQKLKEEAFRASPAHEFCMRLTELLAGDDDCRRLFDGVQVAAWEAFVTTYDDRSEYWLREGWRDSRTQTLRPSPELRGIRSALMKYEDSTLELDATHPSMKTDAARRGLDAIEALIAAKWKEMRGKFNCAAHETHDAARTAGQLKPVHQEMFIKQVNKSLNEDAKLVAAMTSYIKLKIVLRYRGDTNRWEIGSLAEYTDNQDLSRLVRLTYFLNNDLRIKGLSISFAEQ
jgi:hypothetical protein